MATRWGRQVEEALASFQPSDVTKVWNGTSWQHLVLMAAGLDPFGDPDGEPPEPEERGSAVLLVRKALYAVREKSVKESLKALDALEAEHGPRPEVRARIESMDEDAFFASLAGQVAAANEQERLGIEDGELRQAFGGEGLRLARLWLVAKDVVDAYDSSPIEPLSAERVAEAFQKAKS